MSTSTDTIAPTDTAVAVDDLTVRFASKRGEVTALHNVDLQVRPGEFVSIVGPSGCGKSTLLKVVAGLTEASGGSVELRGAPVRGPQRNIGYVFQRAALLEWRTVRKNILLQAEMRGMNKRAAEAECARLIEMTGLSGFENALPHELSGGMQQRVSLCRALLHEPEVLLMDEPFGAIDPITRDRLQGEFLRLQGEVGKTVLFVTHDVDEAVRLGDRIAVLREGGVLEQYAPPADVLGRPASPFVADFVGADRGLKRLSVIPVDVGHLETPVTLSPGTSLAEARAVLNGAAAAVVDGDGRLLGELRPGDAAGDGTVGDRSRPVSARVGPGASLKDASSALLLSDAGWVAVTDGDRLLGVMTPESVHAVARRAADNHRGYPPGHG